MKKIILGSIIGLSLLSVAKAQEISQKSQKNLTEILLSTANKNQTDSIKNQIFFLINQYRKENNKPELRRSEKLDSMAQIFAEYMTEHKVWGHNHESKGAENMGIDISMYKYVIENVAYHQENAQEIVQGWKGSESHNKTMLDLQITEIQKGIVDTLYSEEFGIGIAYPNIITEYGTKKKETDAYNQYKKIYGPVFSLQEEQSKREIKETAFLLQNNLPIDQHRIAYTIQCYTKRNQSADNQEKETLKADFQKYKTTEERFVQDLKDKAKQHNTIEEHTSPKAILDYCIIATFIDNTTSTKNDRESGINQIHINTIKQELELFQNYIITQKKSPKKALQSRNNFERNIEQLFIYCKLQQINQTPDKEAEKLFYELVGKSRNYSLIIGL